MPNMKEPNIKLSVAQTAVLMAVLTAVSKMFGFVRELVLANAYGTSFVMDAYNMSQKIPTIIFGGLLGAVGTAYMPVFSKQMEKKGAVAGNRFTNQILSLILLLSCAAFVFGALFSEQLVSIFAGGYTGETAKLTAAYLRVAFGTMIVSGVLSVVEAYLQYNGIFLLQIVGGYLFNAGIITVALVSVHTSYYYLAFGVLIGYVLQLCVLAGGARKVGLRFRPSFAFSESVQQILSLAIPVFMSSSLSQINMFIDSSLATRLPEGRVAALSNGMILVGLIESLTTSIIITLLYPKMARSISGGDMDGFNEVAKRSMTVILMLGIPFAFGTLAFSNEAVQVIYERGAFNEISTALTAEAFLFYSACIVFGPLSALLVRVYYSMQDMKTPILCSAVSISVNIALDFSLVGIMGHKGLALATSVATATSCVMLLLMLRQRHGDVQLVPTMGKIVRITLSAAASVLLAMAFYRLLALVWMPRMVYLALTVIFAAAVYLLLLWLLKVEELDLLKTLLERRRE